jgi:hypothetical protein
MFGAINGWGVLLLSYGLGTAIVLLALYFVVRLAVLHALKAHTIWLDGQAPAGNRKPNA